MTVAAVGWSLLGTLLLLLVLADVFLTVLFPASGRGPIRRPLTWVLWSVFSWAGRRTSGKRRSSVLAYSGPVQISATIVIWWVLLVLGWALVFVPAVGSSVRAAEGQTGAAFWTAVYFSGFTLSTLGMGDVVATTAPYRVLTVVEAATGFAVMTLVLTYFLSVYSALPARNAFALRLHQLSRETDDAAVLVAVLVDDDPADLRHELREVGSFLRHTAETHRSYPVLRYFHYRADFYALPRLMYTCLDAVALIRSTVDPDRYAALVGSSVLESASLAAQSVLDVLVPDSPGGDITPEDRERWARRCATARATLVQHGVGVRDDAAAAEDAYIAERALWDGQLAALGDTMIYDWDQDVGTAPRHG